MKQTLGIYIGTESIGWTLVRYSTSPRIVAMGTRVFSSFLNHLGEGDRETSNATIRTQVRNARKLHARKSYRKQKLLNFLAENGLCTLTAKELSKWRKQKKQTSLSVKMCQWVSLNPYELRAKGTQAKLSKHELGRVLYHFAQRRGKVMHGVDSSNAKILLEGLPLANRLGLNHTKKHLKKQYLGGYLHSLLPAKNSPYSYSDERVRNRYLTRSMYIAEVKAILKKQQQFHKLITQEFMESLLGKEGNKGLLYYQRPAHYGNSQSSTTSCVFEKEKRAMWKSHPLNEWYNIYCWLDSIRLYGKPLDDDQRKKAIKVAIQFSGFMFKKVRVALKIDDLEAFNYEDATKIHLAHTITHLSRNTAFGDRFLQFSEEEQHELWHDLHFYSDKEKLVERLRSKWDLSIPKAKALAAFKLKPGFSKISMKAARTILTFLKNGLDTNSAIILAGVKNALGKKYWDSISDEKKSGIAYFIEASVEENKVYNPHWVSHFNDAFSVKLKSDKLYLTNQYAAHEQQLLPVSPQEDQDIMRIYKPVAQKPIFELRKLVNKLITEYGEMDNINFVLSNEVKVNSKHRRSLYISKRVRRQELPAIHDAVVDAGHNPTHSNLFKYKLWLEWNKTCPYTGTPITLKQLFSDSVSIVYIHPWNRFFNDSDRNKALCMTYFKANILNVTPYEYFSQQPSGVWENVKTRVLQQLLKGSAKHAPYQKFRHFVLTTYAKDSVTQEFNDQHNMALLLKNYLSRVCRNVVAARGNSTSSLRRKWGISAPKSYLTKPRYLDARESALVALVTAINEPKYLNELRHWNRYEPEPYREIFPTPWKQFTRDALEAYHGISVSVDTNLSVLRKIPQANSSGLFSFSPKGKLHKDSFYGKREVAGGMESYHIKKPVNTLTTAKQVSKIVDHGIRELVYDQIDLCGGFINGKIPKNALITPTDSGWETKVFLPNKKGDKVPVRKVRMRENVSNAVQLTAGQNKYVNPRNNHHVLVYQTLENTVKENIVSFWEAVRRIRNKEPLYKLPPDARMIMATLHINDCFILGLDQKEIYRRLKEGESLWENVYRVQRLSSLYYEFKQIFDLDTYDQNYPNYIRILNFGSRKTGWLTHNPFKISISLLGNISPFYKHLKVPEMH